MNKLDFKAYIHEERFSLKNIKLNLKPLLRIDDEESHHDVTIHNYNLTKKIFQKITNGLVELISIMESRKFENYEINGLNSLIEAIESNISTDKKFNPPLLYTLADKVIDIVHNIKRRELPNEKCKSIIGMSYQIRNILGTYFVEEAYKIVESCLQRTLTILDEVDSSNENEIELLAYDIYEILDYVVQKCRISFYDKRLEFRGVDFSKRGLYVLASKVDLVKALHNIFANAIKYNDILENNSVWLKVQIEDFPNTIKIRVENWGIGISKHEIETGNIFMPGFRGGQAKEANIEGQGLGLYIAKKSIQNCQGELTIESSKSLNSRRWITNTFIILKKSTHSIV